MYWLSLSNLTSFILRFFQSYLKHSILLQCAQEYKHLPESLYPHTYNPKMSLDISAVQSDRLSNSQLLSADGTTKNDVVGNMESIFSPPWAEGILIYGCETFYNDLVWATVIFLQQPDHLPVEENDIDNMVTNNKEVATSNGRNDSKGGKVF